LRRGEELSDTNLKCRYQGWSAWSPGSSLCKQILKRMPYTLRQLAKEYITDSEYHSQWRQPGPETEAGGVSADLVPVVE